MKLSFWCWAINKFINLFNFADGKSVVKGVSMDILSGLKGESFS